MFVGYDSQIDGLYIRFVDDTVPVYTRLLVPDVAVNYLPGLYIAGIEILAASEYGFRPEIASLRITYDAQGDAWCLQFVEGVAPARTEQLGDGLSLNRAVQGEAIGLNILAASNYGFPTGLEHGVDEQIEVTML